MAHPFRNLVASCLRPWLSGILAQPRYLFHSFARPKHTETPEQTFARSLQILEYVKEIGLVLAPETLSWNVDVLSGGQETLSLSQTRICFTELSELELPGHCRQFGPLALAFDIGGLRKVGAMPVSYAPQGQGGDALGQLATFVVRGAYHTNYILQRLRDLKNGSDPAFIQAQAAAMGVGVAPNVNLTLNNADANGNIVAQYQVPADHVRHVFEHVGYNNIPLEHSLAVMDILLNVFGPTDNTVNGAAMEYYRQREWRLIGAKIAVNGRSLCRDLTVQERARLLQIDQGFWSRVISFDGVMTAREAKALLYSPRDNWSPLEIVTAVYTPKGTEKRVRATMGDAIPVIGYRPVRK